jgi:hypothetical protein
MKIQVEIRNVYGIETVYPICDHARFLADMAGTKTFTQDKIRLMLANGYEIDCVSRAVGRLVGVGRV